MNYEFNALIVDSRYKAFDVYEKDLSEFGNRIIRCAPKSDEIITQAIVNNCELIILSQNDFESDNEVTQIIDCFDSNRDKLVPLILNASSAPSLQMENVSKRCKFFCNIYPSSERRSIITEIEKNENFRTMSCDKLFYLLRQKVIYDCKYIGLSKSHEGFRWITEGALLIIADISYRKNFSAGVYKVLGNKYNATYTQIEPAIRRCMNEFQVRMDPIVKVYYFDLDVNSNERYTATGFINKIAENIKIAYKQNYSAFMEKVDFDRRKAINDYFMINR